MRVVILTCLVGITCLAFDTKDEPPPPPPVGHTIYCLNREEVTEALTLWLKEKKLPITGPVTIAEDSSGSGVFYSSRLISSSDCTPTPTPSKGIYLRIKVEYTKK